MGAVDPLIVGPPQLAGVSISLESRALSREGLWVKPDSGKRGP
jgi:hypothetical protein